MTQHRVYFVVDDTCPAGQNPYPRFLTAVGDVHETAGRSDVYSSSHMVNARGTEVEPGSGYFIGRKLTELLSLGWVLLD